MSHPHPTISAWERDEHEGWYRAELHDWKLTVRWTPNTSGKRGAFAWLGERPGKTAKAHESFEEMEHAMADAEIFAQQDADTRAAEASRGANEAAD
jgi:surface antigen